MSGKLVVVFLLITFLNSAKCQCVTYDFEQDYESFNDYMGICGTVDGYWNLLNYSDVGVSAPDIRSEKFISPGDSISCTSSFTFEMSSSGVFEVNIYMESSLADDQMSVLVNQLTETGAAVVGNLLLSPTSPDFDNGWRTLRVTLGGSGTYNGFVTFAGLASQQSLLMVDSFRYIPPNTDESLEECQIYRGETEPDEIGPEGTDPDVTDPDGIDPDGTDPDETDPDGTDPDGTDPDGTDPDETDPDGTDPDGTDPDGTDPDGTDPDGTDPDGTDPDGTDPDGTNPEETDPDGTDPDEIDPDGTDPDGTNPDETDPDGTDPDGTAPDGTDPDGTDPDGTDPDETAPDGTDPDGTDPDGTNPDGTDPEETDPDGTDPDGTDPDGTDPDGTDPDGTNPDETDPDGTDPDGTNPDETDPDETDPDETDPDETDPDEIEPDGTDPDGTDPDETDPDGTDPDETEPEGTEPNVTSGPDNGGVTTEGPVIVDNNNKSFWNVLTISMMALASLIVLVVISFCFYELGKWQGRKKAEPPFIFENYDIPPKPIIPRVTKYYDDINFNIKTV